MFSHRSGADRRHQSRAGGGDRLRVNPLNRNEGGEGGQRRHPTTRHQARVRHRAVTARREVQAGRTAAIRSNRDVIGVL